MVIYNYYYILLNSRQELTGASKLKQTSIYFSRYSPKHKESHRKYNLIIRKNNKLIVWWKIITANVEQFQFKYNINLEIKIR